MSASLPLPRLEQRLFSGIPLLTDDALASSVGIRAGFTSRHGGVSSGAFSSLNPCSYVGDNLEDVLENRRLLLNALDASDAALITSKQVHGTNVVSVASADAGSVCRAQQEAQEGADALLVGGADVAALMFSADCALVILAAPSGNFAIAHAGWRGACGGIVGISVARLCQASQCAPETLNMYVGPHIHAECFEVGLEVTERFRRAIGSECVPDDRHVSLLDAVRMDATRSGVDPLRIVDAGVCTKCRAQDYFSYRASGGVCGRLGAIAFRK